MSLEGVCWPEEFQKETQVLRAGMLGNWRKGRKTGHLEAWFEGSQVDSHSFTQQTSTRQQLGTKFYFRVLSATGANAWGAIIRISLHACQTP